ncbi:MAG: hypothetical protein ACOX40_01385 [Bacilli bacterium]|nr:hypothetical protein [Acholeplasmataceae bacterium]
MLKFLKKLFDKGPSKEERELEERQRKHFFINYLFEHRNDSPINEAMYLIYNGLDLDLATLVNRHQLTIDFDYIVEDEYYDVIIERFEKSDALYLSVSIEGDSKQLLLDSKDYEMVDASDLSAQEIIDALIEEIKMYFK